jgi:thiosulfate dehydrogenase [quinone] large subunit
MSHQIVFEEAPVSRFLFANTKTAWFWLLVRLYVGWAWLEAGWGKVTNPAWTGPEAGGALKGFIQGALNKAAGAHPDVQGWYAAFLQNVVLPHANGWAHFVAYGELLVGIALILGAFTGIAAFFGLFMNLNYLLAGTVSTNPILFTLSIGLILAWKVAGYLGLDRYLLPLLGTPWKPGNFFSRQSQKGFFVPLIIILIAFIIGGVYVYTKQNQVPTMYQNPISATSTITHATSTTTTSTKVISSKPKPIQATSTPISNNPPQPHNVHDTNGQCPDGYVYYGNPLGCVTQDYYNYCFNQYPRGNCPL